MTGRDVRRLHELGYRGLKIIGTRRDYDDRSYFAIYEAAEALSMPILFHCGVIGGGVDYSITHPRRDPKAARRSTAAQMRDAGAPARRLGDADAARSTSTRSPTTSRPADDRRAPGRHRQLRRGRLGRALAAQRATSTCRVATRSSATPSSATSSGRRSASRSWCGAPTAATTRSPTHVERFEGIFEQIRLTDDAGRAHLVPQRGRAVRRGRRRCSPPSDHG